MQPPVCFDSAKASLLHPSPSLAYHSPKPWDRCQNHRVAKMVKQRINKKGEHSIQSDNNYHHYLYCGDDDYYFFIKRINIKHHYYCIINIIIIIIY